MEIDQKKRNQVLTVLFIGVLMGALDIAIVGPALPAIQKTFSLRERTLTWMFTIYILFNLLGTPFMARLSDIYGRRNIYILDVALFAAGSLIVATAGQFGLVLSGRAIQGFGAGGIFPVASAVIGDTFPPDKRGSALGLIGAVFGLAFILGPILGGLLLIVGWEWLFIINLPVAAVVIGLSWRHLSSVHPPKATAFDWIGMLILAFLLASLAYGINQIDTTRFFRSVFSTRVWPFLAATVLLVPIFVLFEKRSPDPVIRLDLFRSRQMDRVYVLSVGAGWGEASIIFLPAFAVAAFGVSSSTASFLLIPLVLALAIGSPIVGRMLDRFGSKTVILTGTALLTLGMFCLSQLGNQFFFFIASGVVIGLGLSSLLGAPLRYIQLNEAPARDRSVAQGIVTLFTITGQLLAGALIGAIAGSVAGQGLGYSYAFLATSGIAIFLFITALGLKGREKEKISAQEHSKIQQ